MSACHLAQRRNGHARRTVGVLGPHSCSGAQHPEQLARAPTLSVPPAARGAHEGRARMANQQTRRLLTINVGSSSLKAVLYRLGAAETLEFRASVERIGIPISRLRVADAQGKVLHERSDALPDHAA